MGVHKKTFFVCIGMFLTLLLAFQGLAFALEAWDDKLRIGGWLRHDSVLRISNGRRGLHGPGGSVTGTEKGLDAGDYVQCRFTGWLEGQWQILDNLTVNAITKAFYEASLDIDSDLEQNIIDAGSGHKIDSYESDIELRELYVNYETERWEIRAGKQQIVWGEAAGFRMSDIVNPLDYSFFYFFPDWEEIRIPLWTLKVTRRIGVAHSLELIWLPGKFDNGFEPNKLAISGANWHFPGFDPFSLGAYNASKPDNTEDNHEWGARFKYLAGSLDTSLFFFYGRMRGPVLKKDFLAVLGAGGNEIFEFPKTLKIGGTFNQYSHWADAVFHGECVFEKDAQYQGKSPAINPRFEKDSFAYMVSADKLFDIPAISDRQMVYTSFQFYQKYIFDFDDHPVLGQATVDQSNDELSTFMTFYISCKFLYERLEPSLYMMYSVSGEGWARPQVTYEFDDYWKIGVGMQLMASHNTQEPYFGPYKDNSCAYAFVKFGF